MKQNNFKHPIPVPINYKGYTITYNHLALLWIITKSGAHIAIPASEDMARNTIDRLTEGAS